MTPTPRSGAPAHIALTGLKHTGKSTLGRMLAGALDRRHVDLDDAIVRRARTAGIGPFPDAPPEPPIRSVYRTLGALEFSRRELAALRGITPTTDAPAIVLSTGGGVCDNEPAMAFLAENYRVLYLWEDPLVLYDRVRSGGVPAFLDPKRPREHFLELADERDTRYRRYAHGVVNLSGLTLHEGFQRLLQRVR